MLLRIELKVYVMEKPGDLARNSASPIGKFILHTSDSPHIYSLHCKAMLQVKGLLVVFSLVISSASCLVILLSILIFPSLFRNTLSHFPTSNYPK